MGTYYLIVNPAKRQFFDPGQFGEAVKRSSVLIGAHATALGLLVCQTSFPHYTRLGKLESSWAGDRIILAGDDGEPQADFLAHASEDDRRFGDWYNLAYDDFVNISGNLIVLMAGHDDEYLAWFVEQSHADRDLFLTLGDTLLSLEHDPDYAPACQQVAAALHESWGADWIEKYRLAGQRRFPGKTPSKE